MPARKIIVSLLAVLLIAAAPIAYRNTDQATSNGKDGSTLASDTIPLSSNSKQTETKSNQSDNNVDQSSYDVKTVSFSSVEKLDEFYQSHNVGKSSRHGTQYVVVEQFPDDFQDIYSVDRKKRLFRQVMLPIVRLENQRLLDTRKQLKKLIKQFKTDRATDADKRELRSLLRKYKVVDGDREDWKLNEEQLQTLKTRIDVIPTSLALAQAANESAWGTSRFCIEANNIFGEWTYNKSEGLKPKGIDESAPHRVKIFPSIRGSIRSYMHNLNTNAAYESFRELRAKHADTKDPHKLVQGLEKYSSQRQDYLDAISNLIRYNNYRQFDQF